MGVGLLVAATALPSFAAADPPGGDSGRGLEKSMQCVACHGYGGVTDNPTFPNLAGQNAGYLSLQLEHFRSGKRYDPVMSPIAQTLSDDDIADLAAYFGGLEQKVADKR
ncbi:MAG: cytochrome C [Rhodospirillaceae bacterium]|nr:cytochrome C [Rhodospirillaceae bacterium]